MGYVILEQRVIIVAQKGAENELIKVLKTPSYVEDDPVRPSLSYSFRKHVGEIFYIGEDKPDAIVCCAYNYEVPERVQDLVFYSYPRGRICVAYTVWSYTPGAGRDLIFELRDWAIENNFTRLVTLSPKTAMAKKFHLRNGALLLRENEKTDNYEYEL